MASKGERVALGNRHAVTALATDKEPAPRGETVWLSKIRVDGGTQNRAALTDAAVNDYCEVMENAGGWGPFPPVRITYDGTHYWLVDGFHRVAAARKFAMMPRNGRKTSSDMMVPATIEPGALSDAVLRSLSANHDHGLRRSNADKRRAVERMLLDTEYGWDKFTDGVIAGHCAVSSRYVGQVRADLVAAGRLDAVGERVGRDGRVMRIDNIGRQETPAPPAPAAPVLRDDAVVVRLATLDPQSEEFNELVARATQEQVQTALDGMRARREHFVGGQVAAARWSKLTHRHESLRHDQGAQPAPRPQPAPVAPAPRTVQPALVAPLLQVNLCLERALAQAILQAAQDGVLRPYLRPDQLDALSKLLEREVGQV